MKTLYTVIAVVMLVAAYVVFQAARGLGFPDGALTEVERAEQPLRYGFAAISLVCAVSLALLPVRARAWVSLGYVVVVVVVVVIDRHLVATLAGGGGG